MNFIDERWGITKEEWEKARDHYFDLGEGLFLVLDEETLKRFKCLVAEERIDAALHLLCYHYRVPGVSVVREKEELEKALFPVRYVPEQRKIILYERAFEYHPGPVDTLLWGFAYHLQEIKHPFHLYDQRIGKIHKEDPKRTRELRESFAGGFVGIRL